MRASWATALGRFLALAMFRALAASHPTGRWQGHHWAVNADGRHSPLPCHIIVMVLHVGNARKSTMQRHQQQHTVVHAAFIMQCVPWTVMVQRPNSTAAIVFPLESTSEVVPLD